MLGSARKRCAPGTTSPQGENRAPQKAFQSDLPADCQAWLLQHGLLGLVQGAHHPQQLPPQFWWALAELNVTLNAYQHCFQEQKLLESHSFTRCPKGEAFEKLAFARGCTDAAALQQQPALLAVGTVVESALRGCADAAISAITLHCPPFLEPWAARWLPPAPPGCAPRLRLLVVQGYRPQPGPLRATTVYNLGLPTITSTPAAATVFVPQL